MGIAYIRVGSVMGAGAPSYLPPRDSATVNTTTTNQASTLAIRGGDYLRVVATGNPIAVRLNATAASEPRDVVPAGSAIDIGPLKEGDVVNLIDVT